MLTQKDIQILTIIVESGKVKANFSLKNLTTMKIGGKADLYIQTADFEEVREVFLYCRELKIPLFVLGGGSNIIFTDEGFAGVVLKLEPKPMKIDAKKNSVTLSAGYSANLAAVKLAEEGWSGFEGFFGLPGTIGGAIYMNSKWPKEYFQTSNILQGVTYLDNMGRIAEREVGEFKFAYGYSSFQEEKGIILSATFAIERADPKKITEHNKEVMNYRQQTQPVGAQTSGCVFKNISLEAAQKRLLPTASAGYLIDKCGLKETKMGKMMVSPIHANFFINLGGATSKEYLNLVNLVKNKVYEKFGINLEEEVEVIKIS